MSGLALSKYFMRSPLVMTALIPLTFQELIRSLFGVAPEPYSQSFVWVYDETFPVFEL